MKRWVTAVLFIAPLAFLFGGFVPTVLIDNWIKLQAGMPLMADLNDHPWGTWVGHLLGVLMVVFMAAGYVVGWLVNAVWLAAVRRWTVGQIRATFLDSDIPPSWRRQEPMSGAEIDALRAEFAEWQETRAVGPARYIARKGLKTSLSVAAVFVVIRIANTLKNEPTQVPESFVVIGVTAVVIGFAIAAILWFRGEYRFAYRREFLDAV